MMTNYLNKENSMKRLYYILFVGLSMTLFSCELELDVLVPEPQDIDFNELQLEKFTHVIPDGGFQSGDITFNTKKGGDGSFSGFAYSRRSNRSLTWGGSASSLDSNKFSVFTAKPNQTQVYAVACVKGEDAFFTLKKPAVIEHILLGNTTYAYFAMMYGKSTGNIANPNIPSAPKGVWNTYVPGIERALTQDGDYFKLIIKGYLNGQPTGTIDYYLCVRANAYPGNPNFKYIMNDWRKAELKELGLVDKVVFGMECSYNDANGQSIIPTWFCLDGIRLEK